MKKSKLSYFLLILLLITVTALTSFALVACNKKQESEPPKTGAEGGVYYYDAGAEEYTVVLGGNCQFTLAIADMARAGSYTLSGETLVLTSSKSEEGQISAVLKDNVITLTFDGAEYRFLKKINFTVTFNSNDGSSVASATVVNGKKALKPADPTRNGYIFVGWYEDAEFDKPFSFNSRIITADTTLFARWVAKQIGGAEYTVEFDAHNGEVNPEMRTTSGGKLFDLPVVERSGYTFNGWWVSMCGDERLSYEFKDGMGLDADTTLHAVWQLNERGAKLSDPVVNVNATSISWDSVGAREYLLKVENPNGDYIVNKSMGGTFEPISFASNITGDYIITVTAVATTGDANNSVTTRIYRNRGLARVSNLSVIEPSTLLYGAVENAEKYLITVDCGDKNHNHVDFDNGLSTNFNFADCMMQKGGIKFTVKAVANGYVTSQSKQFVYAPELDKITEFNFDGQTQKLIWNEITNATGYMVSVTSGNLATSQFVNVGRVNSLSLKEYGKGNITVKVYPVSKMYISPEEAVYTFDKQNLATPSDIRIQGTAVSWNAVDGATSYDVSIAGITLSTDTNSIDLAGKVNLTEKEYYTLTVVAKGDGNSLATDPIDARNLAMADALGYEKSTLSWTHVIGAEYYEVQVNDDPVFSVSDGSTSAKIILTQAGINTLKVRFIGASGVADDWVSLNVYAHTVTFVSDGGNGGEEQYKAVGDEMILPTPQKNGYKFLAWYNTPKGPESNGSAYKDATFGESGDLVLYACYTSQDYTVTYNFAEGTGAKPNDTVYYQKDYQLIVPQSANATSSFGGWFSAPGGNGVQYTDENGNSLQPWSKMEGAEVFAFWFDDVLSFTRTSYAGRPVYAVMQGSRISQVSEVTIPDTYNGLKVGVILGNAFKDCSNLVTLNIPNTLENISTDPSAFTGCSSLEAINVYAVEGNANIRYWSSDGVLFDNGRSDVQSYATLSYMPRAKMGNYTIPNGIVEIPSLAFENSALTRVTVPASVTKIGIEAFKNSMNLASVVFDAGSSPLTIEDRAFENCEALTAITLPARLSSIALNKYGLLRADGSPSSQEVSLEISVTDAFMGCKNLTSISVASGNNATYKANDGILYSANGATLYYALKSVSEDVNIPVGTATIANGAFVGCEYIESVTIPSSVTSVGECAFYNLRNLETVDFEGNGFNDVAIGKYAFRNCEYLGTVSFKDGCRVADIGEGAFFGCGIYQIVLPTFLQSVGAQAFRDCTNLYSVDIKSNAESLKMGKDVFYNCSELESIKLPNNISNIDGLFNGCPSLNEISVERRNPYFSSTSDGILYDKQRTIILFYPRGNKNATVSLPATVTTISDGVFWGNEWIESITIGKNVTKIGDNAFRNCVYLSEVIFEDGGTEPLEIGAYAFYVYKEYDSDYSNEIQSLVLPARTSKIGEYAFAEMKKLKTITLNEGLEEISDYMLYNAVNVKNMSIPASVKKIGQYAFYNCSYDYEGFNLTFAQNSQLESIGNNAFENICNDSDTALELPVGLTKIGYRAFYGSSNITDIVIPNTVKTVEAGAFAKMSSLKNVTFASGGVEDLILGAQYVDSDGLIADGGVFEESPYGFQSIELPSRLTYLGNETFANCSGLSSVIFADNCRLKYIGRRAFYGLALETLTVPKLVEEIGYQAFSSISELTVVDFEVGGSAPLTLSDSVFYAMSDLTTVNLPARVANLDERPFVFVSDDGISGGQSVYSKLSAINIVGEGGNYCSVDGVVYSADKSILVLCPIAKTGTVTIDSNVTKIEENAFRNSRISAVEFDMTSTKDMVIGANAFYGCNYLSEVILPDNVVDIMDGAFSYCGTLQTVTLPASIKEFNPNVFRGTSIRNLNVSENSDQFKTVGGVIFSKDEKTLVLYPSTLSAETYTVPSGVTEISPSAFSGNSYLRTIVLPTGLKTIGASAFSGCTSLRSMTIPNTVEFIKEGAFVGCYMLNSVEFENGGTATLIIEKNALRSLVITQIEFPSRLVSLGESALAYSNMLESVTFAENGKLDSIGDTVFEGCRQLTSITLPEGLNVIGDFAFAGCTDLETVNLPASLTTIGKQIFSELTSLKSVVFASRAQLKVIPHGTFYNCTSLERFTVPASVTTIEGILWDEDYGTLVAGYYGAFQGCTALKSVTFEDSSKCKNIGAYTFYGCNKLEAFTIPGSVSSLGRSALEGCTSIKEIVIPSTATIYGAYLFRNCTSLAKVTLNERATALSEGMFENCTKLKQLNIPASVTSLGNSMLKNSGIETLIVSSNVIELPFEFLRDCESLVSVELSGSLKKVGRYAFYGCTSLLSIELPSNVTTIEAFAFRNCTSLASVALPDSLEAMGNEIDGSAFAGCSSLKNIVLPDRIRRIEKSTFAGCSSLATVKLPSSVEYVDSTAFSGCASLSTLSMDGNGNGYFRIYDGVLYNANQTAIILLPASKTIVNLPNTVTQIAPNAFAGTSITSITLPATMTVIGDYAFAGCTTLREVTILGQVTAIGGFAFRGCTSLTTINLPQSLKEIHYGAFQNCTSLTEIELPAELTLLGGYGISSYAVFLNCTGLRSIVIPDGVETLNANTFYGCTSLQTVKLPSSLKTFQSNNVFPNCTSLVSFSMDNDGNAYFKIIDGVLYKADLTEIICVPMGKTGTLTLPNTVEKIENNTFKGVSLDELRFEGGRNKKFSVSGYSWLSYVTAKKIVISVESFNSINTTVFENWTSEQTICFVESEEQVSSVWHGTTNANVIYNYTEE